MTRLRRLSLPLLALAGLAVAAPAASARTERPIVYGIVVDGLDGDRVDQGKAPFISSLLAGQGARSTYFRESRAVMIAETNPNHTAMVTGAYGNVSGIPGNAFALYSPLESDDSCKATGPEDFTKMPNETSGENANCLVAQTLFEGIKRQGNPDGLLTAGIFGKPKLGRIFAGRRFNGRSTDADHLFAPCSTNSDDNSTGSGDSQRGAPEESYCREMPTNPVTGYAVDDRAVMDEVIRTVREGVGSPRRRPDFTFVNLHQVDSAGHAAGTDSGAYDTAIAMADDEIERLVNELRARGEWSRTVMVLLSDHSMDTTLTKTTLQSRFTGAGVPADRFRIVQNGSVDAVYLANRRDPGRFELLKRLRATALASPGVGEALYREPNPADGGSANTIDGAHPGWKAAGSRSADLFVVSTGGSAFSDPREFPPSNPIPGNHGGPQTRDNFIAVVGGGDFVRHAALSGNVGRLFDDTLVNPHQAENVDLAPTVMGLFGLSAPRDNAGRFLSNAFDLSRLPGGGASARSPKLRVKRLSRSRQRRLSGRRRVSRCITRPRYRISISPKGGRYDLESRRGRRVKKLLRSSARTSVVYRTRAGRRYKLRVRSRSASGAPSRWTAKTLRVRRCKRR